MRSRQCASAGPHNPFSRAGAVWRARLPLKARGCWPEPIDALEAYAPGSVRVPPCLRKGDVLMWRQRHLLHRVTTTSTSACRRASASHVPDACRPMESGRFPDAGNPPPTDASYRAIDPRCAARHAPPMKFPVEGENPLKRLQLPGAACCPPSASVASMTHAQSIEAANHLVFPSASAGRPTSSRQFAGSWEGVGGRSTSRTSRADRTRRQHQVVQSKPDGYTIGLSRTMRCAAAVAEPALVFKTPTAINDRQLGYRPSPLVVRRAVEDLCGLHRRASRTRNAVAIRAGTLGELTIQS